MPQLVKLIVGPSPHYHQLKSGEIKYQKSKPAKAVWRILIMDEAKNLLHTRMYAAQPSAEEIDRVVMRMLSDENLLGADIVVPTTVERLCPGLQERLMAQGGKVYLPAHGFASGSRASRQADEFFVCLGMSLNHVRESMASCEEIAVAAGNALGVVTTKLWRDDDRGGQQMEVADRIAHSITRLRGRDPDVGRKTRDKETVLAPLNKGEHVPPREDVLSSLLSDRYQPLLREPGLKDIVMQLKQIMEAPQEQKLPLLQELGATAILHQIATIRRGHYGFLSGLSFHLRDEVLQYLLSLGMKEAFKMLIVLEEGLLQVSAARVSIAYPPDCLDLSLRGIPAHHHLEKMVQQRSGGKIAIFPDLADPHPKTPGFLQSWGPFSSPWFSSRTPLSPAQCLIPVSKSGQQKTEGLLTVLGILSKDAASHVPIGDSELATEMTALVNERLSRNGKGVTCRIEPLQLYGDVMDIGKHPQHLSGTMGTHSTC